MTADDRSSPDPSRPKVVLCVEDEPAIQDIYAAQLGDMGFEHVKADTLAKGIERAKKRMPDLCILDLNLPCSQGAETVRRFAEACPGVPILAVTGRDEVEREACTAGAHGYLAKPISYLKLVEQMMKLLCLSDSVKERLAGVSRRLKLIDSMAGKMSDSARGAT